MLELKFIRENPEIVRKDLKRRNDAEKMKLVDELLELDVEHRKLLGQSQELRARRNNVAQEINQLKKEGMDIRQKIEEAKNLPRMIEEVEKN